VDMLLGYRHLRYNERLNIQQSVQELAGPFVVGTDIETADTFATQNFFDGVDLGVRTQMSYGAFSVELLTKVAIGATNRTVTIIGRRHSQTYAAVPELALTAGWQLNPNIRMSAAYSVLWWTNVFRPGEQIDVGVNPDLIPPGTLPVGGVPRPAIITQSSSLWM